MPNQQFIDLIAAALPHLTHPGDDNTPPFAVQLPGLAVAGMPPAMAAQFAADAGHPTVNTAQLVAEALAAVIDTTFDVLTKADATQLRQDAADAPDGSRVITIRTTPTRPPVLQITIGKTDDLTIPAAILRAAADQAEAQ